MLLYGSYGHPPIPARIARLVTVTIPPRASLPGEQGMDSVRSTSPEPGLRPPAGSRISPASREATGLEVRHAGIRGQRRRPSAAGVRHCRGGRRNRRAEASGPEALRPLPVSWGKDPLFLRRPRAAALLLLWLPQGRKRVHVRDGAGSSHVPRGAPVLGGAGRHRARRGRPGGSGGRTARSPVPAPERAPGLLPGTALPPSRGARVLAAPWSRRRQRGGVGDRVRAGRVDRGRRLPPPAALQRTGDDGGGRGGGTPPGRRLRPHPGPDHVPHRGSR